MNPTSTSPTHRIFTPYQKFIVAVLAFLQFTIILDFMVLSPLGAILLPELHISTSQFGLVVSAYAFSAGASGLLAAGFADKFDRKKLLLFFYGGFVLGTLLCGIAPNYHFLLMARVITGMFGGVISSVSFAIITDLFSMEVRGRVMGFVQMSFSASQVLGLPIGLYLANLWGWHAPFLLIGGLCILVGIAIIIYMRPVDAHLKMQTDKNAFIHLYHTATNFTYAKAFAATVFLATGGFMLMPFGSAFAINNLGLTLEQLPLLYMITGIFSIVMGPLAGKLADNIGKYKVFMMGSIITIAIVIYYSNLSVTPFGVIVVLNVILFAGIAARMISSSALITGVPEARERGAFMGINSSIQQISGGIASAVAGVIVFQTPDGKLENYPMLGYVVATTSVITIILMYFLAQYVNQKYDRTKSSLTSQSEETPVPPVMTAQE